MAGRNVDDWLYQVGREMSSMADELATGRPRVAGKRFWEPKVDLFEEESRLLIRAEIAGVSGDDIALHYVPERHAIVIRGVREESAPGEGGKRAAHQLEILYGEFSREIALPAVSIDARNIRAQYRNGMLLVMVPKLDRVTVIRTTIVREI